ncbi:XAC2610-related protein [Flectobacillus rivi]|uniref:Uncharacterized protein n=1 Tax=Flectobacillus rivi TaxID=2984209 RepID=A0ABT6ZA01_9BACT|nr:hypothetical protein [Flectobacillus rivi]MDI9877421.1 hypothetical protein [Flectobacillus rivi]
MKKLLLLLSTLWCSATYAQSVYTGTIDKYPIELVLNIYSDDEIQGIYVYTSNDEPIDISGSIKNKVLSILEKDAKEKVTGKMVIDKFSAQATQLSGTWTNPAGTKSFKITLTKKYDLDDGEGIAWSNRELLQKATSGNQYFKIVLSKAKDEYQARVKALKVYEKKTDKLLQTIAVDCQPMGFNSVETGDFNFDGQADISLFESSYAGANTSSKYFLVDGNGQYKDSGFEGVSLTFDAKTKRITEVNQCCAGSQYTSTLYKVANNKMVKLEQHCFIYDEKKQDFVERKLKDCQ